MLAPSAVAFMQQIHLARVRILAERFYFIGIYEIKKEPSGLPESPYDYITHKLTVKVEKLKSYKTKNLSH